ncbi:unnamed protein product [Amoebophrya sp. A25]|nr:unnamed protein product [Amoebophrya sp. A25]|eukprot:GSA25T00012241001.1
MVKTGLVGIVGVGLVENMFSAPHHILGLLVHLSLPLYLLNRSGSTYLTLNPLSVVKTDFSKQIEIT